MIKLAVGEQSTENGYRAIFSHKEGEVHSTSGTLKTASEYIGTTPALINDEQSFICTILDNSFKNGIKLGSLISIKKFGMEFCRTYPDYAISDDVSILREKIRQVTIHCLDDLYMSPNMIEQDKNLIIDIISLVIDTLNSEKKVIYIENIYNRFKERLLESNIYNIEILHNIIKHYLKNDVIYTKGAIYSQNTARLNIYDEVLEVLAGSDFPLSKQEVFDILHHLSQSKIEHILKCDKRSIYVQKNVYWHIDRFEVTPDDKILLDDIIRYEIKDGFISIKKLLDVINTQATDFIQKNNIFNHVCLRDILKYHFADDFNFKYTFIGKPKEEISRTVAFQNFIEDKDGFLLSDLIDFVEENDLPKQYGLFLAESKKFFIRISDQEFIRKSAFNLSIDDIKNIEEVIHKYLTNGYVAISKIDSFAIFPSIDFQWNSFLLESIIENYCNAYEVIDFSKCVTKPVGVIVSKAAEFNNYDEILIDVLVTRDKYCPFMSIDTALEYLFDNGYISQKRFKEFESLYSLAMKRKLQRIEV